MLLKVQTNSSRLRPFSLASSPNTLDRLRRSKCVNSHGSSAISVQRSRINRSWLQFRHGRQLHSLHIARAENHSDYRDADQAHYPYRGNATKNSLSRLSSTIGKQTQQLHSQGARCSGWFTNRGTAHPYQAILLQISRLFAAHLCGAAFRNCPTAWTAHR